MGEKTKKAKNRLISFACLGVFALSLVVATFSLYRITSLYKERQVLEATKQKMIEEQTYLKNQNNLLQQNSLIFRQMQILENKLSELQYELILLKRGKNEYSK